MLIARFDGGSVNNPGGPAACSFIVYRDAKEIHRDGRFLGSGSLMTNNIAEFEGMKMILMWARTLKEPLQVIGDSQIVINRMNKMFRGATKGNCAQVAKECVLLAHRHQYPISFIWQRRDNNDDADSLCNDIIAEYRWKKAHYEIDEVDCSPLFAGIG